MRGEKHVNSSRVLRNSRALRPPSEAEDCPECFHLEQTAIARPTVRPVFRLGNVFAHESSANARSALDVTLPGFSQVSVASA